MNKYLENLQRLFDEDDKILYQALLEKKDWILNSFYIIGSLEDNHDIEDICDGLIRFRRLMINPALVNDRERLLKINNEFNDKFRVCYLYEDVPFVNDPKEFIIKLNFKYMNETEYRALFANFYPCLEKEDIALKEEENLIDILKLAMDKNVGDDVIILDEHYLTNSRFPLRVVEGLLTTPYMNEEAKLILSDFCKRMNLSYSEVKYDNC